MASARRINIADGDLGTQQTVAVMGELIREGALSPDVRAFAVPLVADLGGDDPILQVQAIRDWLADHFQFVRDPSSGELLHGIRELVRQLNQTGYAAGDCDDAAILGGALAASVGFHVALTTVAILDSRGQSPYTASIPYSHVWASVTPPFPFTDEQGRQAFFELDVTRPMQDIPLDLIARAEAVMVC